MKSGANRLSGIRGLLHPKEKWLQLLLISLFGVAFLWDCGRLVIGSVMSTRPPACDDVEQICLSLKILAREAEADLRSGGLLREEVETLAGINWVEGFVVDGRNRDVILIGRSRPNRPPLYLDDLVVNMQNVWESSEYPYCSLDPRPEDVLKVNRILSGSSETRTSAEMHRLFTELEESVGPQQVVVGGVPRDSRHAHVMIDADYEMKKVSQDHVELSGVTSCLDRLLEESANAARKGERTGRPRLSMSRYWFHLRRGDPKFVEGRGIVYVDRCSVVVLTEQQKATASGELYDAGGLDPHALAFAREFSDSFNKATTSVPVYADLEHLYRLNALTRAMRFRHAPREAGLDLKFYLGGYKSRRESPMPPNKPGLANYKEATEPMTRGTDTYECTFFPMVCGGVSMDIPVHPGQFCRKLGGWPSRLHSAAVNARPHANSLCWTLP